MNKTFLKFSCAAIFILFAIGFILLIGGPESLEKKAVPADALFDPDWQNPPLSEKDEALLSDILKGPFHYLSEGGQSYVFESEDQKYVLKLFKFHRFQEPWYLALLPELPPISGYKQAIIAKREKRRNKLFEGYKTAFFYNRDESGLLFLQLKPDGKRQEVRLHGKHGGGERIDLGKTAFVIQRRGEQLDRALSDSFDREDVEGAKRKIDQVLTLYLLEYSKGIYDRDHGVIHNVGFVEDRPLHLDVGEMAQDPLYKERAVYREDLKKVTEKILAWVKNHYPKHYPEISRHLDQKIEEE